MTSVYRIRPCNGYTIDEIENHYLWFSRRRGFKDVNDANIGVFLDNNETLFQRVQSMLTSDEIQDFIKKMDCTGICCFTNKIPTIRERKHFPNSLNSICLEYDNEVIDSFFENSRYAMHNCFCDVQYLQKPIEFVENDKDHILLEKSDEGILYESIFELTRTEKGFDRLVKLLLTRISSKYYRQNEKRIILGGRNIPSFEPDLLGYKVEIPENAIVTIHAYKDTPQEFINEIHQIRPNIKIQIVG